MGERPPTEFEQRVYEATSQVPFGCVTTYKLLGRAIGCRSSQAVGQALKRNPGAPVVPCHRVISSDLRVGGFAGERGGGEVERKLALLAEEGVLFDDGALCDPKRVFDFGMGED